MPRPTSAAVSVPRSRRRWGTALLPLVLAVTGCTSSPEPEAGPSPSASEPPVSRVDLSGLPVARAAFCDLLDQESIGDALGGTVIGTDHYDNGDEVNITPDLEDISHEFNCTYYGAPPAKARVWVFARPVLEPEARSLVREARRDGGCSFPDTVGFGSPYVASVCRADTDQRAVRVRLQGLFGDSWLSCELTRPGSAKEGRTEQAVAAAEQWCTDVVTTIGARP